MLVNKLDETCAFFLIHDEIHRNKKIIPSQDGKFSLITC